jgi:hypothetical protein
MTTMVKVKFDKITTEEVEVEIPAACPSCKADLTDDESVTQDGYVGTAWYGNLSTDAEGGFKDGDTTEDCYELNYVTGYRCARSGCRYLLAGSEG